ncbi:hypothetical protein SOCE26_087070 [Sorangium cellulosum]|uniref:Uncharacterized protein n=1 Tax=Sorangium cellulosum TaxID=56 RepID=A0A2L0F6J4_SORCE|nr:hypothetical protein [Sorangium cellulosum]AUX47195.1 hypothetical protein SOCE26_087070 [Sorangium cellulosum]
MTMGNDQYTSGGYKNGIYEGGSQESGAQEPQQAQGGEGGVGLDALLKFAKDVQSKVKDVPYIVPIAIGGAAFAIGVLASSKILRQLTLLAGGYVVKYAIQNAPKDQIVDFAKKVVSDSFRASSRA